MVGLQTMEVIVHSSRWMDLSQQNDRLIRVFIWPWILPGGRPQPVNISLKNNPSKKIHWKWPIYNGWYWFDGKYTSHSIAFDSFPFVSVFVSFQNFFHWYDILGSNSDYWRNFWYFLSTHLFPLQLFPLCFYRHSFRILKYLNV